MKRYDLVFNEYYGGGIGIKENGKYCEYADYERTKQQRDRAIELLKDVPALIQDNGVIPELDTQIDEFLKECEGDK